MEQMRIQDVLMSEFGFSKRMIVKLKGKKGEIRLNGEHIRMIDRGKAGDLLTVVIDDESHYIKENSALFVPVVYEDDDVIVYNKPPNMPVHPSRNHQNDTLANYYTYQMNKKGVKAAFRPINRLDRDTSGLCVVAKNGYAAAVLNGKIEKEYTAILCGTPDELEGKIDAPIVRLDDFHIKRAVGQGGQQAVTLYRIESSNGKYSLARIKLMTGRTHQIRVHFSHIGYPLAGDEMYGGSLSDIKRQALCCNKVGFLQPYTGKAVNLCINIHDDMQKLMQNE